MNDSTLRIQGYAKPGRDATRRQPGRQGRGLFPALAALWLLCVAPTPGLGQAVTQTITLKPGWNTVFLEVAPGDPGVGGVFASPSVSSVWEPKVRVSTVAFIQNQNEAAFNRGGWAVYVPTNRAESINNDLYSVSPNHAYLVNLAGNSNVTFTVTGRPSLRLLAFQPDAYTLRGFPADPASPPTFQTFFAPSSAHYSSAAGLQKIYRLNNASSQWELVAPTDLLSRGVAYWVYTSGASSYQAPLTATPSLGDGLDFGLVADEQDLTLQNNTASPMAVSLTDLGAGNRPLSYYYYSPTNTVPPAWLALPQVYSLTLAPGAIQAVRLGIQRSQMTNDSYGTVLAVSDGNGTILRVAVSAQRPSLSAPVGGATSLGVAVARGAAAGGSIPVALQAGLWVGTISVNAVAETYNNLTNTTPAKTSFDMRLILHVRPDGSTRFLREVIEMFQNGTYTNNAAGQGVLSQPGQTVLLTDDRLLSQYTGVSLRDGTPVGRRISTAGFDFDPPGGTNFLTMSGAFGIGNTVGCVITLTPASPTNPFLHRYHPDHDNLDSFYAPLATNVPPEVYTITRQIRMTFSSSDPAGQNGADYGYNEIGGVYGETLTGLHRNPLVTSGIFHLRRISETAALNANQ